MLSALLGGSEQTALLSRPWARGLTDGRLAFLPYDTLLFTLPSHDRSYRALGAGGPLQEACDAVLPISLESSLRDKAFEASGADGEAAAHLEPEQVGRRRASRGPRGKGQASANVPHPPGNQFFLR